MASHESELPVIDSAENGPYIVKQLGTLKNAKGEDIPTKDVIALCRCGGSANKPFCDGTHAKNGFESEKLADRTPDRRETYVGKGIAIHDNRGVCAHAGVCTDRLAAVWRMKQEPWIDPDGAAVDAVIQTITACPSGALSYSTDGVEHRDRDRAPAVQVTKDGPYRVTGAVTLKGEEWGEGASAEHYTLCRCGGSNNKPFCDGSHWHVGFKDG